MKARQAKKIYNNLIMGSTRYNTQQIVIACHLAMKYYLINNTDWRTLKEKKQWNSKWKKGE